MAKSKDKIGDFSFGFNAKGAKKSKGGAKGGGKGAGKKRPAGRFKNGQSWS